MKSDEIKMDVNIAGERISLSVPFSRQVAVRNTEAELMALYRAWGEKFPNKSPKELLAMIAYKFASMYFDLIVERKKDADDAMELLEIASRLCEGNEPVADDEFPLY